MPDEKKLIIDEDWKSQVEAEKQQASQTQSGQPKGAAPAAATQPADPPMPPASFELLLTTLATEALIALGQVPHPATGRAEARRNQAQYLIDTIDVLEQKTKGNLTPDERQMIESLLHQLRMAFIDTAT
jgi:hypothetical protein